QMTTKSRSENSSMVPSEADPPTVRPTIRGSAWTAATTAATIGRACGRAHSAAVILSSRQLASRAVLSKEASVPPTPIRSWTSAQPGAPPASRAPAPGAGATDPRSGACLTGRDGRQAGGAGLEIAPLGEAGGGAGGVPVPGGRGGPVARELVAVGTDGGEPVMARHPLIGFEARQQAERCLWAVHHRHRDGTVERHDRAGRDPLEEVIERQDLQ